MKPAASAQQQDILWTLLKRILRNYRISHRCTAIYSHYFISLSFFSTLSIYRDFAVHPWKEDGSICRLIHQFGVFWMLFEFTRVIRLPLSQQDFKCDGGLLLCCAVNLSFVHFYTYDSSHFHHELMHFMIVLHVNSFNWIQQMQKYPLRSKHFRMRKSISHEFSFLLQLINHNLFVKRID